MKETEESASDSLRSSVSSPGIPKTYLTPSASRHSTKTSDARRALNLRPPDSDHLTWDPYRNLARFPESSQSDAPTVANHRDPRRPRRSGERRCGHLARHQGRGVRAWRGHVAVRRDGLREARQRLPRDPRALLLAHGARAPRPRPRGARADPVQPAD